MAVSLVLRDAEERDDLALHFHGDGYEDGSCIQDPWDEGSETLVLVDIRADHALPGINYVLQDGQLSRPLSSMDSGMPFP